jgi:hypothetical protein
MKKQPLILPAVRGALLFILSAALFALSSCEVEYYGEEKSRNDEAYLSPRFRVIYAQNQKILENQEIIIKNQEETLKLLKAKIE